MAAHVTQAETENSELLKAPGKRSKLFFFLFFLGGAAGRGGVWGGQRCSGLVAECRPAGEMGGRPRLPPCQEIQGASTRCKGRTPVVPYHEVVAPCDITKGRSEKGSS